MDGICGVYLLLNKEGEIFYIGSSRNLKKRLKGHPLYGKIDRFITIKIKNYYDAYKLENCLIRLIRPKYNYVASQKGIWGHYQTL